MHKCLSYQLIIVLLPKRYYSLSPIRSFLRRAFNIIEMRNAHKIEPVHIPQSITTHASRNIAAVVLRRLKSGVTEGEHSCVCSVQHMFQENVGLIQVRARAIIGVEYKRRRLHLHQVSRTLDCAPVAPKSKL